MVPELEHLMEKGRASGDPDKVKAADALQARLDEVLNGKDHQWYLGKMGEKEKAKRKKAAEEFKARYAG